MKEATRQKTVGCVLVAGIVISVVSFILIWVFAAAGVFRGTYTREPVTDRITDAGTLNLVPLMILFLAIGVLMIFGAVGYGLFAVKTEHKGPRNLVQHFRILARYAYDKEGNYMMDDHQIEHSPNVRFYVRGHVPNGEMLEYEASEVVWRQCGEGMYGEAELQGKWIGRFTPYVGTPDEESSAA